MRFEPMSSAMPSSFYQGQPWKEVELNWQIRAVFLAIKAKWIIIPDMLNNLLGVYYLTLKKQCDNCSRELSKFTFFNSDKKRSTDTITPCFAGLALKR